MTTPTTRERELFAPEPTAFVESPEGPRYLAVYGAVVAIEALRVHHAGFELQDETVRRIVDLAHCIAKRSEDVQP